jgi:hypothetical protein
MRIRWPFFVLAALCLAPPSFANPPKAKQDKQPAADAARNKTYQIPYRLTNTMHVMVRAKVNGKGPFNFIIDTGAPLLYITTSAARKIGLPVKMEKREKDKKEIEKGGNVEVLERFDIEGGAGHAKIKVLVETPFQLEGMNAMGMPGEELHGIIGYVLLAHYRMEFDFTRDRMVWTRLAGFNPPPPVPLGVGKDKGQDGLDQLGKFMKAMAVLMGKKMPPPPSTRGFLGVELEDADGAVVVKAVLKGTAAAKAGLAKGDRITEVQGKEVGRLADVLRYAAKVTAGDELHLTVMRNGEKREVSVTAGEGL